MYYFYGKSIGGTLFVHYMEVVYVTYEGNCHSFPLGLELVVELIVSFLSDVYSRERIRNRWLVAYTLIRNPSLVNLTANNLPNEQTGMELVETCDEASVQVHKRYVL